MRRYALTAALLIACTGSAFAGPVGAGSGPITVDSTTFVPGSSVMGTDGGVYSDTLPPIASTTTAAFRMTKYRAEHVNLRDTSGAALGVSGNPLFTTGNVSVNISTVQVVNSSFSVTGSTVNIQGTVPVTVTGSPSVAVLNSSFSVTGSTVSVTILNPTVAVSNTGFALTNVATATVTGALPAGTNNIGTVTGSSITITNPTIVTGSTVTITNTSFTVSGTANVSGSTVTIGGQPLKTQAVTVDTVTISGALPAGSNSIGTVNVSNNPLIVSLSTTNVSGSTITVSNAGFFVSNVTTTTILGTPTFSLLQSSISVTGSTVSVSGSVNSTSVNVSTVSISGTPSVNIANSPNVGITGNPLVTVSNSSFSVTGSTVNVVGSFTATTVGISSVNVVNVPSVIISGTPSVLAAQSGTWVNTLQVLNSAGSATSVGYSAGAQNIPVSIIGSNVIASSVTFATPTTTVFSTATINTSSSGDNTIVSAGGSQTVRVFRIFIVVGSSTTISIKDGSSFSMSGPMTFGAGGSYILDFDGDPWFVTSPGNNFIINQTGTAQISGRVYYTKS